MKTLRFGFRRDMQTRAMSPNTVGTTTSTTRATRKPSISYVINCVYYTRILLLLRLPGDAVLFFSVSIWTIFISGCCTRYGKIEVVNSSICEVTISTLTGGAFFPTIPYTRAPVIHQTAVAAAYLDAIRSHIPEGNRPSTMTVKST